MIADFRPFRRPLARASVKGEVAIWKEAAAMYALGMIALLGLAVLAIGGIANRYLSMASEIWAFVLVALGVGAAWLINLNLFAIWSIPVRNSDIAVTVTGIVIGGVAYFWRVLLRYFSGMARKFTDQARSMEKSEQLRRVA